MQQEEQQVPIQKQQKLTREEKRQKKYEARRIKNKIQRKKIAKSVKDKIKVLDQEQKNKYFEMKKTFQDKLQQGYDNGIPIYVDMDYDILMDDKEIKSLALQISHIVGINKELEHPVQLHLTNVKGKQKEELEKQGSSKWLIHMHDEDIQQIVSNYKIEKEFIYLSPDADEELEEVDPQKYAYIIGGLSLSKSLKYNIGFVDKQIQKFMSYNKAGTLQICSRKLPIDKFMIGKKRPLNIDQVVTILSLFNSTKDWEKSFKESLTYNVSVVEKLRQTQEGQKQ